MADIDLERKKSGGMGWLWGLLALIALIALVWWLWPDNEPDYADTEIEAVEPITPAATPEPMAGALTIAEINNSPDQYVGQSFPTGPVTVVEVPTDRGFWIEEQGERLFAIIIDGPEEVPLDINPEQTLMMQGGTLRDASYLSQMPGEPLDARTRELVEQEEIYLVVDESNIDITEGGNPQPGTTPAQSVGGN